MARPLVRSTVRALHGYVPGEQPAPGARVIKLNTNENPYPPSPRVMEAIRAVPAHALQRYPRPMADEFRSAAARVRGVGEDAILAGNVERDDILTIVTCATVSRGRGMSWRTRTRRIRSTRSSRRCRTRASSPFPGPATGRYPSTRSSPPGPGPSTFVNPNAPSGTAVPVAAVEALARAFDGVLLGIDEAAMPTSRTPTAWSLALRLPNVVVSRTMSKSYSARGRPVPGSRSPGRSSTPRWRR